MKYNFNWDLNGLWYASALLIISGIIIVGAALFNIADPSWMLISGVVCTELEEGQIRSIVESRIVATLTGVIPTLLIVITIGPSYLGMMLSILTTSLICHYVISPKNNWKLATATGLIVILSGLQHHSLYFAESIACKRALEVMAGSFIAAIVSFILGRIFRKISTAKK